MQEQLLPCRPWCCCLRLKRHPLHCYKREDLQKAICISFFSIKCIKNAYPLGNSIFQNQFLDTIIVFLPFKICKIMYLKVLHLYRSKHLIQTVQRMTQRRRIHRLQDAAQSHPSNNLLFPSPTPVSNHLNPYFFMLQDLTAK